MIQKILSIMTLINKIQEIKEFNDNRWFKFLFWFLAAIISIQKFSLFNALFGKLDIILKIIYIYSFEYYLIIDFDSKH
jgi:hypothetical protein